MMRYIFLLVSIALGLSASSHQAFAAGPARVNQERCYQAFLALRPALASSLDWPRTPATEKLELLDEGTAVIPGCAYLHYLRGVVLDSELGRAAEALGEFEKAVEVVPNFDLAHENIAILHRAEARRSFERPALRPETKDDAFRLTRALAALRRAEAAVAQNPMWGRERREHLRALIEEVGRELEELKSPEGNVDFLDYGLRELVVTHWRANVRTGFALTFPKRVTLKRGEKIKAASDHSRYGWIKVRLADGQAGWVYHNVVK